MISKQKKQILQTVATWVFIWKCSFSYKSNSFSNEKFWTKTPFWNRGRTETRKSCGLLRRDLRWVAKLASFLTSTRKSQKTQLQGYEFHWLIGCYNNEWTSLNLRWVGLGGETLKNVSQIECKFWSQPNWVQVNASADKAWSNEVASKPKFSICFMVYLYFSPREKYVNFYVKSKFRFRYVNSSLSALDRCRCPQNEQQGYPSRLHWLHGGQLSSQHFPSSKGYWTVQGMLDHP